MRIAALLALTVGCGGATVPDTADPEASGLPQLELVELTDHVVQLHVVESAPYYSTAVLGAEGAVVIDPTSDHVAARWVEELRARNATLRAIVYSHWHLDHASGADVLREAFGADVPVVGHERARLRQASWNEGHPSNTVTLPTDTFGDEGRTIDLGDAQIRMDYMGHGHSDNMLVITVAPDRLVYACDFVGNRSVGYSNLPGIDIEESIAMNHRVGALDVDHVAFCHAAPGTLDAIREYRVYFEQLWERVAAAIAEGQDEDAAAASVTMDEYRDWAMADAWLALNVRGMFRWLVANPEVEMPTGPTPVPPR